jgi:hypothetical protein
VNHRLRRLSLVFVCSLLFACAKGGGPGGSPDMHGRDICPDNPSLCPGTCCNGVCVDTSIDVRNCGSCGTQCETGTVCADSRCGCLPTGTACGSGQSCCGNAGCKSLMSDINNCGACGKACGTGSTCAGGVCKCGTVVCTAGQVCCNGACAGSCTGTPDMAAAACVCPGGCPLSNICVGPSCCFEDVLLGGSCSPDPACVPAGP